MQNAQERVELAFKAFFCRVKAHPEGSRTPGYPRFKGYGRYDSFTFKQSGFKLVGDKLTISKIGDVRIKLHRPICGAIKTLTIQRDSVGNWYACFSCECDPQPLEPTPNVIGIELGLTTFAYFSNGDKIARQRWMKQDDKDIARASRAPERKKEKFVKGNAERRKAVHALCHAYERAANRRNNFVHQFIAFEKPTIQEIQVNGNKTINRGIADVAWGQFAQFTTYKAENAGRVVALVNPRGTTQTCSAPSGHPDSIVPKDLSVHSHDCPTCGLKLSRDHNAALNILARGLASINAGSPDEVVEAQQL